jgi:predicted RNase H-like HicB family nuclease
MNYERVIILTENQDGRWTAHDEDVKLTAQGESPTEALEKLDAVIDATKDDGGHEPTDEKLHDAGINPEQNRARSPEGDRTFDELDLSGTAPDGRWPSSDDE